MTPRILVVAPKDDLHAQIVSDRIEALGASATTWNTTWFPWRDKVSWTSDGVIVTIGGEVVRLNEVDCIWWRRFSMPTISPVISDAYVKQFCISEALEVMRAVMDTAVSIVNDPRAERHAESKLLQLRHAKRLGLNIPKTLVSNDPNELRSFVALTPEVIIKPLVCDYPHSIETRRCDLNDLQDDEALMLAPTLLQELVVAAADIRCCIVGECIFAAELRRHDINDRIDWRMTVNGWVPHVLPGRIAERLLKLVRSLFLDTGSVDLRLTPEGEYVFLEINPSGQFMFLEVDAGLPVSQAFAQHLVSRPSVA